MSCYVLRQGGARGGGARGGARDGACGTAEPATELVVEEPATELAADRDEKALSARFTRFPMFWKRRSLVSSHEIFFFSLLDTCKRSAFTDVAPYLICMKPHEICIETGLIALTLNDLMAARFSTLD